MPAGGPREVPVREEPSVRRRLVALLRGPHPPHLRLLLELAHTDQRRCFRPGLLLQPNPRLLHRLPRHGDSLLSTIDVALMVAAAIAGLSTLFSP